MILQGDCVEVLKTFEARIVQTCVTSPPYYGLRNYGVEGQIGLESTPEAYVARLVETFREVWRVMKDDGTLWLNLGDSYWGGKGQSAQAWSTEHQERTTLEKTQHQITGMGETRPTDGKHEIIKAKDLIGIPWRVAFALQQPFEHVLIKDRADRAWLAGIIDGEGCITSNEVTTSVEGGRAINASYPIILQVRMSDRQALDRIVYISGVSKVRAEHLSPSQVGSLQRPPSNWKTSGENSMRLLAECYPYLTVKKQQAIVAWNLQKLKDGVETKRGVPIPKENMEKRKHLYTLIRDLNQRREVDLPSWLKEPIIETESGYYLRSDIVWSKPNPMPESVKDRPTKSHEYIFLMTKQPKYYYDAETISEPANYPNDDRKGRAKESHKSMPDGIKNGLRPGNYTYDMTRRNRRSVWTVTTMPYKGAHFATFPPDLIEPCILAGTSAKGECPKCGKAWVRVTERQNESSWNERKAHGATGGCMEKGGTQQTGTYRRGNCKDLPTADNKTLGWQPQCECGEQPIPQTVLDPFNGSGTTGAVALKHGRDYIGIELNPKYIELTNKRLASVQLRQTI
jgi:DNA modification methylase